MKRALLSLALLAVSAALHAQTFGAVMTGAQEVPVVPSGGYGNATVIIAPNHLSMTVDFTLSGVTAIDAAHIHEQLPGAAPGTSNGPVVVNLLGAGAIVGNHYFATIPIPFDLAARITANPQNYYLNVHTKAFPDGAARGTLAAASPTTDFAGALRGSSEIPPTNVTEAGSYLFTLDGANNLTCEIHTGGLPNPTMAHIHEQAGDTVVSLASSSAAFQNGRLRETVNVPDSALVSRLVTTPQNFYVNVHSAAFPDGAIRGQLAPANEYDIPVAGKVTNGLGQNFVTDVRIFNPSYDSAAAAMIEYFPAGTGVASSTLTTNLAPRATAVLDDVNGPAHLNSAPGIGALRITSSSVLAVTSRIYNDLRAGGKGTFGQFVPATPRANALRRGVLPQLSNTALDPNNLAGYRTNVGFFNPNAELVPVRLELRDADGTLLGTNTLTLTAYLQQQTGIAGYFPGIDLSAKQNLTMSFDAAAPIVAYASVVDNVSSDQIFVAAQNDVGVAAQ